MAHISFIQPKKEEKNKKQPHTAEQKNTHRRMCVYAFSPKIKN